MLVANKVLSIKMDERDIERLRNYYNTLTQAGFLSTKATTLNAFYKHLLLDYLEKDILDAFEAYSEFGISPQCINPEELKKEGGFSLFNTYDLDEEMFENYRICVKEELSRSVDCMRKNAELFNEVVNTEVIVTEGMMHKMECIPRIDRDKKESSFWQEKAYEAIDLREKEYRENSMAKDIEMIDKSSIPEDLKQKLIHEIEEYEKKKKQNFIITQGRGILK